MSSRAREDGRTRKLLIACASVVVLILILALLETRERRFGCDPLEPLSAEVPPATVLESPARVQLDPVVRDEAPPVTTSGVADSRAIRLRGRVVDARTNDGVPFVDVYIQSAASECRVRANTDGTFESTSAVAPGTVRLEVFDREVSYGSKSVEFQASGSLSYVVLPIAIGPTVYVNSIGSGPVRSADAWSLCIVESTYPYVSAGEIAVRDEVLQIADGADVREWTSVQLRFEGASVFARWPTIEFPADRRFFPRLCARSDRLSLVARAELMDTIGTHRNPAFDTTRIQVFEGRLSTNDRQPLKSVRVLARPRTREAAFGEPPDWGEVESGDDSFTIEVRGSDSFTLVAWSDGYLPSVLQNRVSASRRTTLKDRTLVRVPGESVGSTVDATTPGAEYAGTQQFVRARTPESGNMSRAEVYEWPRAVRRDGRGVPRSFYTVELVGVDRVPLSSGWPVAQILPDALKPIADWTAVATVPHRIEWFDRDQDRARDDFVITAGPSGCMVTTKAVGAATAWDLVPRSNVQFTAWRAGCEPVAISGKDFQKRDGECVASIHPQPGWGVSLSFRVFDTTAQPWSRKAGAVKPEALDSTRDGFDLARVLAAPALPGVGVLANGSRLGQSDADGNLLVRARIWPTQMSLRARGWRLMELERMPGPGVRWIAWMEKER
ncbi:MAG: hypothetical protein JNL28_02725 [Planctomycetes bacterium]|nr:hypothetical protein [Planctomycetota bacterium]